MKKNTMALFLGLCIFPLFASNEISFKPLVNNENRPFFQKVNTYYPPNTRFVYSKQVDGKSIILDDGSEWRISKGQSYDVRAFWYTNDPIVVSLSRWTLLSRNRFYITNLRTGSWVYADIFVGPLVGGPFTNRIYDIDLYGGKVYLIDGRGFETCFEIDPNEHMIIQDWQINQAIFLGSCDNPLRNWNGYYDFMLFNVEKNRIVKGKRF